MNYVYVDLGAYNGDSLLEFMKRTDLIAPPQDFGIYLFEPNPIFEDILRILKEKFENIKEVSCQAAWIDDSTLDFAIDTSNLQNGSSLMKGKKHIWNNGKVVKVKTFDFSSWIKQFGEDYVIVKMDIEGAEFPILKKMIEAGTDKVISELWLETHPNKVTDYTTDDKTNLLNQLKSRGINIKEWH